MRLDRVLVPAVCNEVAPTSHVWEAKCHIRMRCRLAVHGPDLADGATQEATMLDLLFVAMTVGFFALAWAYVRGCDHV